MKLTDFQRGVLFGLLEAEKMVNNEIEKESEKIKLPFGENYKLFCGSLGILLMSKFTQFKIEIANKMIERNKDD